MVVFVVVVGMIVVIVVVVVVVVVLCGGRCSGSLIHHVMIEVSGSMSSIC